jgi:hypothetical protein
MIHSSLIPSLPREFRSGLETSAPLPNNGNRNGMGTDSPFIRILVLSTLNSILLMNVSVLWQSSSITLAISQTRTVSSDEPDATSDPSGEKTTLNTMSK